VAPQDLGQMSVRPASRKLSIRAGAALAVSDWQRAIKWSTQWIFLHDMAPVTCDPQGRTDHRNADCPQEAGLAGIVLKYSVGGSPAAVVPSSWFSHATAPASPPPPAAHRFAFDSSQRYSRRSRLI